MKLQEIIHVLNEAFPLERQEKFDNSGLQLGDPNQEIQGALLTIDIDENVLDEAKQKGLNLVVAHHPILFHPAKQITPSTYIERCIRFAIKNDIAIFAAHTNADNSFPGLNTEMAGMIGLTKFRPLIPLAKDPSHGGGLIGELSHETRLVEIIEKLKEVLNATRICHSPANLDSKVKKIAMCTGSGSFMYSEAKLQGADIFITGEAKYNDYYDAQDGPVLLTAGHYETEWISVNLFKSIISSKLPNFACHISEQMSNPVNYL